MTKSNASTPTNNLLDAPVLLELKLPAFEAVHITLVGCDPAPVNAAKIKRAAETQNKKVAKRFLALSTGPHTCQFCDKTFDAQKYLNIHIGRMHKAEMAEGFPTFAQTADDASVA